MKRFAPYPYQRIVARLMDKYPNIDVVKSRQLGISQLILSKFLDRACRNPAYVGMAFLRNADDASAMSKRTRQMVKCLDKFVIPENDNVGLLRLKGKGEIHFKNSSSEGSRSYDSVRDFLFDEAAFAYNIAQIYSASSPSQALMGNDINKMVVSTPSAKSGWYWDKLNQGLTDGDIEQICIDVAEGRLSKEIPGLYWFENKGTIKLVIHWKAHPVYSKMSNYLEYRMQQDGTDEETVLREYDLRFIDASVTVFEPVHIRECAVGRFEEPCSNSQYFAGIDTSTTGNDYTVCTIWKFDNGQLSLVAVYRQRKQTSDYHIYQISSLLKKYKVTTCGVEVTGGVGQIYFEQLSMINSATRYERINTSRDTKSVMVNNLKLALERSLIKYPSDCDLINEMLSFRQNGMRLEAAQGKNDDCVMSAAFAVAISPLFERDNFISINTY